jgi:pyrophosphate--fructose-6-phosphate 1-phosphotransferase
VDTNSVAMQVFKAHQEKWLAATAGEDHFRRPGPICCDGQFEEERPLTLELNAIAQSKP